MKLVIPGGSGQVGAALIRHFASGPNEITVLSRGGNLPASSTPSAPRTTSDAPPAPHPANVRIVAWDGRTLGDWTAALEGADAVINLAGRSVNCRYHAVNRRDILQSRVDSTRVVGEAIAAVRQPPRAWLQSSTATIYAHRFDAPNDETSGQIGGSEPGAPETWRFSIDVARAWEAALDAARTPRTRKVALRSAMTMSPDRGGIFDVLLTLVRRGLGGPAGGGRQFVSWIHERDFVRAIEWLIGNDSLSGPVNLASPNPLPQAEFMAALRAAWGTRIGLPAARWMLELGAIFMCTETELVLKSRRVIPGRLLAAGFVFEQPSWPAAARELCERWRRLNS